MGTPDQTQTASLCSCTGRPLGENERIDELLNAYGERGAAVQPARLLARVVVLRRFLTVAARLHPGCRNASRDEVVAHASPRGGRRARGCIRRADAAGVAFDDDVAARVRLELRDRVVEEPKRLRTQRRSGRSRSRRRRRSAARPAPGALTWMLTVSDAVLLSVGHVTVTVTGTAPSWFGAVHTVWRVGRVRERAARGRPAICDGAADRARRGRSHRRGLVRLRPCSDRHWALHREVVSRRRSRSRCRRRRGRRWWRRHVHPDAGVISDPDLPVPVVAEREVVRFGAPCRALLRRHVPAQADADEEAVAAPGTSRQRSRA